METKKCVVVLSGGPDSAVVAYWAKAQGYQIHPITFKYGQIAVKETEAAEQIEGTMGRRVQKGVGEVTMMDNDGKMSAFSVKMGVQTFEGFSGHSDRRQLVNYLTHLSPKPERIFVVHGEKQKTLNFGHFLDSKAGINTVVPSVLETFRLL